MYNTVREALDAFMRFVGEPGDATSRQTALDCLNLAYHHVSTAHEWRDQQSPAPLSLTLTANRSRYSLPSHLARITGPLRNMSRGGSKIEPCDEVMACELYPQAGTTTPETGVPAHYRLVGITGVRRQPNPAGQALEVVSDSTSDTAVTVTIAGDDVNGEKRERSYTVTGTTAVAVGTWSYVDSFSKAYADATDAPTVGDSSVGTVTLQVVTGGTVLQALDPQESAREHKVLQFFPTPQYADEVLLPFVQRPRLLVQGSDPLPVDWWPALKEGMEIEYRRNTGEIGIRDNPPRPALLALIVADNKQKPRPMTRPFRL